MIRTVTKTTCLACMSLHVPVGRVISPRGDSETDPTAVVVVKWRDPVRKHGELIIVPVLSTEFPCTV